MKCTLAFFALLINSCLAVLFTGHSLGDDVIDLALVGCPAPLSKNGLLQKKSVPDAVTLHTSRVDLKAQQQAQQQAVHWQLHWGCVEACGPHPVHSMCVTDCEVDMYQCIDAAGPGETQKDIDECQAKVLDRVASVNGGIRKEIAKAERAGTDDFLDSDYIHDDRPEVLPKKPCPSNCATCTADGKTCRGCKAGYDLVRGECTEHKQDPQLTSAHGKELDEQKKQEPGLTSTHGEEKKVAARRGPIVEGNLRKSNDRFGQKEAEKPIAIAKARQKTFGETYATEKPIAIAKSTQKTFGEIEKWKPPRPLKPIAKETSEHTESFGRQVNQNSVVIARATQKTFGKIEQLEPPRPLKRLGEHLNKFGRQVKEKGKPPWPVQPLSDAVNDRINTPGQNVNDERPKKTTKNMRGAADKSEAVERKSSPPPPLERFMPSCLAHLKRLIYMIDHSYTDMNLQTVLKNECLLEKNFPESCDAGFERVKHCKDFAEQLHRARILELDTGSEQGYKDACKDYWQLRMGTGKRRSD